MNKRVYIITALLLLQWLSGCAGMDYVRDASEKVKAADWSKMQTVDVLMTEYKFSPSQLVFKVDVPHKLVIRNEGKEKHYFVSEDFFKAIALRKIQSTDGEVKAPYLNAVEVYPGKALEIYFVPVQGGTYDLICTIEGHAAKGMAGKIRIENGKKERGEIIRPNY